MVSPFVKWREIFIAGRNAVIARNVRASWPFLKWRRSFLKDYKLKDTGFAGQIRSAVRVRSSNK
jgi:hypothetical protein